jgi:hypothetical protein
MGTLQKSMLQDIDHVRFCIALSTELYTYLIHPQCNEKEREHPIQLNTRRDLDPLHSSCNQRPAMGTPQMCNCFPKQLHQNTAPLSPPSNNHYRTRRQQSRDEPTAFQIEPNLCASAHHSLAKAQWSCQQSSVPTTHTTTPCPARRRESTHKIRPPY